MPEEERLIDLRRPRKSDTVGQEGADVTCWDRLLQLPSTGSSSKKEKKKNENKRRTKRVICI